MKPDQEPTGPIVLTKKEARQGTTKFPLRYVLATSLVLVVIALVVAFLVA